MPACKAWYVLGGIAYHTAARRGSKMKIFRLLHGTFFTSS